MLPRASKFSVSGVIENPASVEAVYFVEGDAGGATECVGG